MEPTRVCKRMHGLLSLLNFLKPCKCLGKVPHRYFTIQCLCLFSDINEDFSGTSPSTVSFPAGSVDGNTSCLSIPIIDDDNFEGDHSFTARIMGVEPDTVNITIDDTLASIMIQDNDGKVHAGQPQEALRV